MNRKEQVIRELIKICKLKENMTEAMKATADSAVNGITFTQDDADKLVKTTSGEAFTNDFIEGAIDVFDGLLTEEQAKIMCNFYTENPWCVDIMVEQTIEINKMVNKLCDKYLSDF